MKKFLAVALVAGVTLTGLVSIPASAKTKQRVVYQTVAADKENAFFDIDTLYHLQLAQSLSVAKPMTWTSVEMGTYQIKMLNEPRAPQWLAEGKYDEKWFDSYMRDFAVKARVTLEVWRYDGAGQIGDRVDLKDGFTRVHRSTLKKKKIQVGKRVTFPLKGGVDVEPGRYFFVIGTRFLDPLVFNLRFTGQENGTNTLGGYDHDQPLPADCAKYDMTVDAHPGGMAYRPIPQKAPSAPDWMASFVTTFEVAETKVSMGCDMEGVYGDENQIWNPGDLGLIFRGQVG